jgi:hypothetical protein
MHLRLGHMKNPPSAHLQLRSRINTLVKMIHHTLLALQLAAPFEPALFPDMADEYLRFENQIERALAGYAHARHHDQHVGLFSVKVGKDGHVVAIPFTRKKNILHAPEHIPHIASCSVSNQ